jgi:hypothetical protein
MIRRIALPLFLLMLASFAVGQTTYVQTTSNCGSTNCTGAKFTPSGTLSYSVTYQTGLCGSSFTEGTAIWNGQEFHDFTGSYKFIGYAGYPFGKYLLQGTFNNGLYTVSETFKTAYRSCSPISNLSGTVVGPN